MPKVMFSSLSVALSVCLSVCLSVTGKHYGNTAERIFMIFQDRWDLIQGTIGNIFKMVYLTPWTQDFFPTFSEESMTLSSITEKTVERIFMKVAGKDELDTRSNLEHFRMLRLTPWILGFVCNIMGKRVNGFSWFFLWNVSHDTKNN